MPRTQKPLVQALIENVDCSLPMDGFIATASGLVDWLVTKDAADSNAQLQQGTAQGQLPELIERWLAAHFFTQFYTQYQQKTTGRAGGTKQGQTTMVFMNSPWGQQACGLDVTGRLAQRSKDAELGLRRVASVHGGNSNSCSTDSRT